MNSLVLFEIILALSGLASLAMLRHTHLPSSLFWAIGLGSVTVAAVLGAFAYAGIGNVVRLHDLATSFADNVGLVAIGLAALTGLGLRIPQQWGLLVAALAVGLMIAVLLDGSWRFGQEVRMGVVILLVAIALFRFKNRTAAAGYLLGGVALFAVGALGREWIAAQAGMNSTNVHHLLLAVALPCFALSATRS